MENKKTDDLIKLIGELQEKQIKLIKKMEGLEKMLYQKETEKITLKKLEKILRYPKDYGFNYTGKTNVGDLMKRAEKDKEIPEIQRKAKLNTYNYDALLRNKYLPNENFSNMGNFLREKPSEKQIPGIQKKLKLDDYDYRELLNNEYLPDRALSERIVKFLKIPWSDFIMAKANTYRMIQETSEGIMKPYAELNTIDLLDKISQLKPKEDVFSFVSNLFLQEVDGNLVKKPKEEIERIFKIRQDVYLLEYPELCVTDDKKYETMLMECIWRRDTTIFVRLEIENITRYYKLVEYNQEYDKSQQSWNCYFVIKNLKERQFANIQEEEFYKMWEKTEYELIAFNGRNKFYDFLKNLSEHISFSDGDRWETIRNGRYEPVWLDKAFVYSLFKSKWIYYEYGSKKKRPYLGYTTDPNLRD